MSLKNSKDWKNDPEYIELINFLIEKTRNVKSPMSINQLAEDFKEKSGSSQVVLCLVARINRFRHKIDQVDTIDKKTKVKMMFALSASIDKYLLNELRKDADVEVDGKNRIIKYRAKDGSLEFEGDHSKSAKMKDVLKPKINSEEDHVPKTPGSVKRSATEVPNPSKRAKNSSPARFIKILDYDPDDSSKVPESSARETSNSGIQQPLQPKVEGALDAPIKTELEANDAYTPQIKLLEAMKFLITPLDMPSLSPLLTRIEKKLLESSPNTMIPNNEMILAMAVLVTKITNHSMPIQSENGKSVSLREFMCYLKAAIMNSKLEGLEGLLEKIRGRIEELAFEDKNIPAEKVTSALQATVEVIGL